MITITSGIAINKKINGKPANMNKNCIVININRAIKAGGPKNKAAIKAMPYKTVFF